MGVGEGVRRVGSTLCQSITDTVAAAAAEATHHEKLAHEKLTTKAIVKTAELTPSAAKESAPPCPTNTVSTRDSRGSAASASAPGTASAKMAPSCLLAKNGLVAAGVAGPRSTPHVAHSWVLLLLLLLVLLLLLLELASSSTLHS